MKLLRILPLFLLLIGSACNPANQSDLDLENPPTPLQAETENPIDKKETPGSPVLPSAAYPILKTAPPSQTIWINALLEEKITATFMVQDTITKVSEFSQAAFRIDFLDDDQMAEKILTYYYVISTPFDSMINDISLNSLKTFWRSTNSEDYFVWVNESDVLILEKILGNLRNDHILISDSEPEICAEEVCLRIAGFEDLTPAWHIVNIDGQSLLDRSTDLTSYPLQIRIGIFSENNSEIGIQQITQQESNFDPEQLSVVILTGTTALTRGTAFQMEENGVLFPAENVEEVLKKADLLHISHEVPIFEDCPSAVPLREEMRFCSAPYYIQLFRYLDVDVVELTGNHMLDWGPDAFLETLNLYKSYGFPYYGAGVSITQAAKPLMLEDHGNKFVFIGCNISGPDNVWVSNDRPGVQQCGMDQLISQVGEYRDLGYLPIVTFQHFEVDDFEPITQLKEDFWAAAEAGAVIVSGSQAHFPQGVDFVGNSFVHYGLGNLFFDQMANWYRKATVDIHYFYQGAYINTQLVSIINENQGQPRIMTDEEEVKFLSTIFEYSFYYEK